MTLITTNGSSHGQSEAPKFEYRSKFGGFFSRDNTW